MIRRKFFDCIDTKPNHTVRSIAATLKDYRSIQVKLLQTFTSFGVDNSEEDLARLLSGLPEVKCQVKECICEYHKIINEIVEVNSKK
jgi:hypothetical protein